MTSLATNNPTQQVFELVLARPVDTPDLQHAQLVHLIWRAPEQGDRLVQVYLNGQLAAASRSIAQREMWLMVDNDRHTEIELLAVHSSVVTNDLGDYLAGINPSTQPFAALRILRDTSLPADSCVSIEVDGASHGDQTLLFSPSDSRGGFGAVFGEGGFGYDNVTGPGLGLGELGLGPLGSDGRALQWRSDTLAQGSRRIDISLQDAAGVSTTHTTGFDAVIDRLPDPPGGVALTDELTLTWT